MLEVGMVMLFMDIEDKYDCLDWLLDIKGLQNILVLNLTLSLTIVPDETIITFSVDARELLVCLLLSEIKILNMTGQ